MAESATRDADRTERGDARFRHASLPFLVRRAAWRRAPLLLARAPRLRARTRPAAAPLARLAFHADRALRLPLSVRVSRLDASRSRIASRRVRREVVAVVGFAPRRRVHIIVDDPVNDANGYAFTPLDAPTIVLWPVSPEPRSDIGDYAVWQELLATHEFAHVAHLTRPSRNRWQRFFRGLSPGAARPDRHEGASMGAGRLRDVRRGTRERLRPTESRLARRDPPAVRARGPAAVVRSAQRHRRMEVGTVRLPRRIRLHRVARPPRGRFQRRGALAPARRRRPTARSARRSRESTAARRRSCMGGSPSSSPRTPSRSRAHCGASSSREGRARAAPRALHRRSRRLARRSIRRPHDPEGERAERARRVEDRGRARHARRAQTRQPAAPGSGGRAGSLVLSAGEEGGRDARRERWLSVRDAALVRRQSPSAPHAQHARARRDVPSGSLRVERRGRHPAPRHARSRAARRGSFARRPVGRGGAVRAWLVRSRPRRSRHPRGARAPRRKRDAELQPPADLEDDRRDRRRRAAGRSLADRACVAVHRRAPLRRPGRRRESFRCHLRRRRREHRDHLGARWLRQPRAAARLRRRTGAASRVSRAPRSPPTSHPTAPSGF